MTLWFVVTTDISATKADTVPRYAAGPFVSEDAARAAAQEYLRQSAGLAIVSIVRTHALTEVNMHIKTVTA